MLPSIRESSWNRCWHPSNRRCHRPPRPLQHLRPNTFASGNCQVSHARRSKLVYSRSSFGTPGIPGRVFAIQAPARPWVHAGQTLSNGLFLLCTLDAGPVPHRPQHPTHHHRDSGRGRNSFCFPIPQKLKRDQRICRSELAGVGGSGGFVPGVLPHVAWHNLRSTGNQSHRKTHGLWVHERRVAESVLSSRRPVAVWQFHQLLLLWPFHDGLPDSNDRRRVQRGLQPGRISGARPGGNRRFWTGLQPGPVVGRQSKSRDGLWRGWPSADPAGRKPGRRCGVCSPAGLGQQRALGVGRHQGSGRNGYWFRGVSGQPMVVVQSQPGDRHPVRRPEPGLHHHRVPVFQLHPGRPAPSRNEPAIRYSRAGRYSEFLPGHR